jgi:hypothetical protein
MISDFLISYSQWQRARYKIQILRICDYDISALTLNSGMHGNMPNLKSPPKPGL